MALSLTEQLSYSTIRIGCDYADGTSGTGTGFFMRFLLKDDGGFYPVLVTNKHVVKNAKEGRLLFCVSDENGNPIDSKHFVVHITDFHAAWIDHPDPNVDLCVMLIGAILTEFAAQRLFYIGCDISFIPSEEELSNFSGIEDIVMVGYPNGLWDSTNNKPIFRRGVTATHVKRDYCGKKEFLIDAACFPGSSGSPVYILNEGSYQDGSGITLGSRLKLLGILYAGPQYTAQGQITIQTVPTRDVPVVLSTIPNNLGLIIKASRLREMEQIVKNKVQP